MNIFLFGWIDSQEDHAQIAEDLLRNGHTIQYWVSPAQTTDHRLRQFPGTIFHHHEDAWCGRGTKSIESNLFSPPGAQLIHQMHAVESLILSMMNKRFDYLCVDERRHLYYSMLGYWNGVLRHYKPDALVFVAVPHTVYDYLAYELAKMLGIKTLMFDSILISDRMLLLHDFRTGSNALGVALKSNITLADAQIILPDDLQTYHNKQTNPSLDNMPRYVLADKKKNTIMKRFLLRVQLGLHSIQNGTIVMNSIQFFTKLIGDNIQKEYTRVQREPDLSKPFVYIPLNYQPECTTSPQGDIFVDLRLMIEIVSRSIPKGWYIYVKEHPSQWYPRGLNFFSARYRGYYRQIGSLNNVVIIPRETNSFSLINTCKAVVTVSGTPAWEALLRSCPAVIFGHPWYQQCPGLLHANDVESCRRALASIEMGYRVEPHYVMIYLQSLGEATIRGYVDGFGKEISTLSKDENVRSISSALIAELAKNT